VSTRRGPLMNARRSAATARRDGRATVRLVGYEVVEHKCNSGQPQSCCASLGISKSQGCDIVGWAWAVFDLEVEERGGEVRLLVIVTVRYVVLGFVGRRRRAGDRHPPASRQRPRQRRNHCRPHWCAEANGACAQCRQLNTEQRTRCVPPNGTVRSRRPALPRSGELLEPGWRDGAGAPTGTVRCPCRSPCARWLLACCNGHAKRASVG